MKKNNKKRSMEMKKINLYSETIKSQKFEGNSDKNQLCKTRYKTIV